MSPRFAVALVVWGLAGGPVSVPPIDAANAAIQATGAVCYHLDAPPRGFPGHPDARPPRLVMLDSARWSPRPSELHRLTTDSAALDSVLRMRAWTRNATSSEYQFILSTGFAGYRFVFRSVGDTLKGRMLTFVDLGPSETVEGPATAVRTACP
jgi:hypothetical protein